ncbi:MAG: sulfatase-like hydrolase/transferase [Planctomycetota bacterium]|nr:sulfatase-like hydrolase/transferase [Planctomycetota bacterium]
MVNMNRLLRQNGKTNHWSLVAFVVVAILTGGQFVAAENPPNVVVILVDDLGYGDLGSYGATDLKSPHIDALVSQGMKFSNFYANCPVCSPTRASLLTGRYPELVGVPGVIRTFPDNNWGELSSDAILLPGMLESAGYDSAIVGKWHLGLESPNRPTDRGFDFFHGYLGDMMDDYYKHRRHGINYMRMGTREIDPQGHATDLFTDWACDYLRGRTRKKAPFFLYLAYNAPHTPIQPPEDWVEKVLQREKGIDPARARLVALIEHMDDGIGKVMETISKTDLASNTLVIFTSDNGGQLSVKANNGPLRDGKQSMYEGGLKVPACAVWPDKIAPGSHSDRLAITMDLFATICDVAGVSVKHTIEGRSILPTLLGTSQAAEDRDLFFHRREGGERYGGLTIHAIRRGEWKLLQNSPFAPMELYNLTQDPAERNDLANDNRKVYREMLSALRVQIQRGGAVPWQRPARRDVK